MQKYRKDIKKHMSDEDYEAYKLKKKRDGSICRGGKPHDFVLVLPSYVGYVEGVYKFNPEEYYRLKDEELAFCEAIDNKIKALGIKSRYHPWRHKETRYYMCSVCKKQRYGE